MPERRDPYGAFRFLVVVDDAIVASFTECSGLQAETEFEEYQEGGEHRFRHKLPKSTRYGNLTLRRGLTDSSALWDWYQARASEDFTGNGRRKRVAVVLWDGQGRHPVWRWDFDAAYPVKWTGPELKADTGALASEAVEVAQYGRSAEGPR
jgi:phage tail-like protein